MTEVVAVASPNLALVKYWGKASVDKNLPATTSIGITLEGLTSTVTVARSRLEDEVVVDGKPQKTERFRPFLNALRRRGGTTATFSLIGENSFPGSAGLASSASGFAAAAKAGLRLLGLEDTPEAVSSLARIGSASAARSAYGGICRLEAGSEAATPLFDDSWWPELRLLVLVVSQDHKPLSSRGAMELARTTSPYYRTWVDSAPRIAGEAAEALSRRDLPALGMAMQESYLGMFSTMFTSVPPVIYWLPGSLAIIHRCRELREAGIPAWETMDAGPQVKVLTTAKHLSEIRVAIESLGVTSGVLEARSGGPPAVIREK